MQIAALPPTPPALPIVLAWSHAVANGDLVTSGASSVDAAAAAVAVAVVAAPLPVLPGLCDSRLGRPRWPSDCTTPSIHSSHCTRVPPSTAGTRVGNCGAGGPSDASPAAPAAKASVGGVKAKPPWPSAPRRCGVENGAARATVLPLPLPLGGPVDVAAAIAPSALLPPAAAGPLPDAPDKHPAATTLPDAARATTIRCSKAVAAAPPSLLPPPPLPPPPLPPPPSAARADATACCTCEHWARCASNAVGTSDTRTASATFATAPPTTSTHRRVAAQGGPARASSTTTPVHSGDAPSDVVPDGSMRALSTRGSGGDDDDAAGMTAPPTSTSMLAPVGITATATGSPALAMMLARSPPRRTRGISTGAEGLDHPPPPSDTDSDRTAPPERIEAAAGLPHSTTSINRVATSTTTNGIAGGAEMMRRPSNPLRCHRQGLVTPGAD